MNRREIRKEMFRNNVGERFTYTFLLFENLKVSNCLDGVFHWIPLCTERGIPRVITWASIAISIEQPSFYFT